MPREKKKVARKAPTKRTFLQSLFESTLRAEGVKLNGKRPEVKGLQEGSVTFVFINGRHNKFGWAKRTKGEAHSSALGYQIAITRLVRSMRGEKS